MARRRADDPPPNPAVGRLVNKSATPGLRATTMLVSRLVVLHRRPSVMTNPGWFTAAIKSADRSLRRGPCGLPDWPFWKGRPRGLP